MISLYYGSVFPYTGCLFPPASRGIFYSCLCTISCCVSWDVLYWFDPEGSVTMWGWLCIQRHAILPSPFASSQTHLKLQRTVFKTWTFKPSNGQQLFYWINRPPRLGSGLLFLSTVHLLPPHLHVRAGQTPPNVGPSESHNICRQHPSEFIAQVRSLVPKAWPWRLVSRSRPWNAEQMQQSDNPVWYSRLSN